MVQLKEVEDEAFTTPQPGPPLSAEDEDYYTDTDSEISSTQSVDDLSPSFEESLADRLLALRDVIPPSTRRSVSHVSRTAYSWLTTGLFWGGKSLWVISTSAMLIGIPWALAFTEEAQMVEMEREMRMQQNANETLAPGAAQALLPGAPASGRAPL